MRKTLAFRKETFYYEYYIHRMNILPKGRMQ